MDDALTYVRMARLNLSRGARADAVECLERAAVSLDPAVRSDVRALATKVAADGAASADVRARALALSRKDEATAAVPEPERPRAPAAPAPRSPVVPVEEVLRRLLACELDLAATIDLALDLVLEATKAGRGFILVRSVRGKFDIARARGLARESLGPSLSASILAQAERTRTAVFVDCAIEHPEFGVSESVQTLGLRSVACVPIMDEGAAELVGAIYLDDSRASELFGAGARELLTALGRAVAGPLRNARRFEAQRAALAHAKRRDDATSSLLVGASAAMREAVALLTRAARHSVPVLIEGESGTGKELAARTLHALSSRASEPFVAENLAALAPSLVEAELFGVEKGAFTGADRSRDGLFVRAGRGTLFLDEVGELPLEGQAKLLRAIQEREVRPVGGSAPVPVAARIVAATNRDLAALAAEGRFREDLLYRLRVVVVRMPPLRERLEDVPALAEHILERIALERGEPALALSREALKRLVRRPWPGNVRELESVLWRVSLAGESAIDDGGAPVPAPSPAGVLVPIRADASLEEARAAFDRVFVAAALAAHGGNGAHAARALGITRTALWRIAKRLGIARPKPAPGP